LGSGDDFFESEASLGSTESFINGEHGNDLLTAQNLGGNYFIGGLGRDRLLGGPGRNGLSGRRGSDELIGNADFDYIVGGGGADRLVGGGGGDRLLARDHQADKAIRCGGSPRDWVERDKDLDPIPRGCPRSSK
jgi:Ca2+-binding RTX toxin-like protein